VQSDAAAAPVNDAADGTQLVACVDASAQATAAATLVTAAITVSAAAIP
jgi:hypothetical protein